MEGGSDHPAAFSPFGHRSACLRRQRNGKRRRSNVKPRRFETTVGEAGAAEEGPVLGGSAPPVCCRGGRPFSFAIDLRPHPQSGTCSQLARPFPWKRMIYILSCSLTVPRGPTLPPPGPPPNPGPVCCSAGRAPAQPGKRPAGRTRSPLSVGTRPRTKCNSARVDSAHRPRRDANGSKRGPQASSRSVLQLQCSL